ncbi:MAG: hypothetical protein GWP67_14320 [Gammaproteobacteria bacterium]|nr:hypothetical protein [Gammaproteobacteria bacterium]
MKFADFLMMVAYLPFAVFPTKYIRLVHCDPDEQPTPSEVDDEVALGEKYGTQDREWSGIVHQCCEDLQVGNRELFISPAYASGRHFGDPEMGHNGHTRNCAGQQLIISQGD